MDIVLISSTTRYSGTFLNYSNEPSLIIEWLTSDELIPNDELLGHILAGRQQQNLKAQQPYNEAGSRDADGGSDDDVDPNVQEAMQKLRQEHPPFGNAAEANERFEAVEALLSYVMTEYQLANPQETIGSLRQALTITEEDIEAGDEFGMTLQDQKVQAISGWLPELQTLLGQPLTIINIYDVVDNDQ
jgi:hypothetical protein